MLLMDDVDEFSEFVRINGLEIVVFVNVSIEIIEERLSLTDNKFPVALPNSNHLRWSIAHFPIEEVVLLLLSVLASKG